MTDNIFTYITPIFRGLNYGWIFAVTVFGAFHIALLGLLLGVFVMFMFRRFMGNML